ncbi:hypothetical protein AU375_01794 [Methylobacterium radiotolerans]|nr:hypothetical protein AU375_01794 [Methylobacterium radiotolerans]
MFSRLLTSLFLLALRSPVCGWVVRTMIIWASREASPRGKAAHGGAGKMVPVR